MEQLLLEVEGRFIRILLEDDRDGDAAVLTLVCRTAHQARILPQLVPPPDTPGPVYPGMPRGLAYEATSVPQGVRELTIDTSNLPSGRADFGLAEFSQHALTTVEEGTTVVRLDAEQAAEWGMEEDRPARAGA